MLKLREVVIVEGKYDKARLQGIVDALIIETRGFRIFQDAEQRNFIKKLAAERGLLVLTDSDSAGFLIRSHLKSFVPDSQIKHAYIPQISGMEKRKTVPSKEGTLGVEGMDRAAIERAIAHSGIALGAEDPRGGFVAADLYQLGLLGGENSREKRARFVKILGVPEYLSTSALLKYMNLNFRESERALVEYSKK